MKNAAARYVLSAMGLLAGATSWAGTEGNYSTFYGFSAGVSNSADTNSNTFIGSFAGDVNTSGKDNTFLGNSAGFGNHDGIQNSYLGSGAGSSNVSGSHSTYVGGYAGNGAITGSESTLIGAYAGFKAGGDYNTFLGAYSGYTTSSGTFNTYLGTYTGYYNTTGGFNTFLGGQAGGNNVSGSANVFIGNAAGYSETGSNKLYIDNCHSLVPCDAPLVYGEFDTNRLRLNAMTEVHYNGQPKSQLNFSLTSTDTGGYITSVGDNNFFMSSGARYDGTAGGWVQRSTDNKAVVAGSGGLGYRIFADSGQAVTTNFAPTVRLHIDYAGNLGLNQMAVAGTPIQHSSGAHLTVGGVWTDASSREYKENVKPLSTEQAMQAVAQLVPVTYNYKTDSEEKHVGFIAEDVPDLVATKDRKSLSPMDIVAALTKVVQEKSRIVDEQKQALSDQAKSIQELRAAVAALQAE
jgi:hypothetical protein